MKRHNLIRLTAIALLLAMMASAFIACEPLDSDNETTIADEPSKAPESTAEPDATTGAEETTEAEQTTKTMLSKYEESAISAVNIENIVGKLMEELGVGGFMGVQDVRQGMKAALSFVHEGGNKKNEYVGFKAVGHAGYGEAGEDIVCAAISVLTINTINAIDAYTNKVFSSVTSEKSKGNNLFDNLSKSSSQNIDKLSQNIQKHFADIAYKGREITVRIAVEKRANISLSDESIEGDKLVALLSMCVQENKKKQEY